MASPPALKSTGWRGYHKNQRIVKEFNKFAGDGRFRNNWTRELPMPRNRGFGNQRVFETALLVSRSGVRYDGPPEQKIVDRVLVGSDGPIFDLLESRKLIAPLKPVQRLEAVAFSLGRLTPEP
jgi:hypothetical protein